MLFRRLVIFSLAALVAAATVATPPPAEATPFWTLYGTIGRYLVQIDSVSGAATAVGPAGDFVLVDLAYHEAEDQLYAIGQLGNAIHLVALSRGGVATDVGLLRLRGSTANVRNAEALAYNNIDGELYAAVGTSNTRSRNLVRVDTTTAEGDFVVGISGTIEGEADGMEFADGDLYIVDIGLPAILYQLNQTTGSASSIGVLGPPLASNAGGARDMAYDPVTGALFGTGYVGDPFGNGLITIDPTNAGVTLVGKTHDATQFDAGTLRGVAFALDAPSTLAALVDLKPDSARNSVNPRSKGVLPVAVIADGTFDVTTIDSSTVRFGPGEAVPAHSAEYPLGHLEDVDGDGDLDVLFHFRTQDVGVSCGMTELELTGALLDGQEIAGTTPVRTVGCK